MTQEPSYSLKCDIWKVACYERLSSSDESSIESDSIENQHILLTNFITNTIDLSYKNRYKDDGYTGLNFNRPGFKRMLADIESGLVNCVIVKDLSRLGRDMIGMRNHLENIFPSYNIRFISVLDNLDSYLRPYEIGDIFTQFKQLINEHYSRDISIKKRKTNEVMRNEGKKTGGHAPYGYLKDPNNKHHLLIDKETAHIVKEIFELFSEGMGAIKIAQHLNNKGILSPSQYKKKILKINGSSANYWSDHAIRPILKNIVYIGHIEQFKSKTKNYKNTHRYITNKEERILVKNTHEAIISEQIFYKVQEHYKNHVKVRTAPNQIKTHLFSGLLRCEDCGSPMIRTSKKTSEKEYAYYKCRRNNMQSRELCQPHTIKEEVLKNIVFNTIKSQIYAMADLNEIVKEINHKGRIKTKIDTINKNISERNKSIKKNMNLRADLYIDLKDQVIGVEEFNFLKDRFTKEIEEFKNSISCLKNELDSILNMQEKNLPWLQMYLQHYSEEDLSRKMLLALVDKIYISNNKTIRIVFRYENEISKILNYYQKEVYPDSE